MTKTNIITLVIAGLALAISIATVNALPDKMAITVVDGSRLSGDTNYDSVDTTDGYKVDGSYVINGSGNVIAKELTTAVAVTSSTSVWTITTADSGTTYLLSASGTTATLPAVTDGVTVKFIVNGALTTDNYIIDSAEGDNIEGTLIVAGAVVDCDAEDQINIVIDGENIGDYVELISDGTQWLIGDSGVLTAAKMTCTDP